MTKSLYIVIVTIGLTSCATGSGAFYTGQTVYEKRVDPATGKIVQWECRLPTLRGKDCKPQSEWAKPSIWEAK